jgi:hypothetical protein
LFTITYEDEVYKRWNSDYVFEDLEDVKDYLKDQGFIENNRIFQRKDYNWSNYVKAYIKPLTVY